MSSRNHTNQAPSDSSFVTVGGDPELSNCRDLVNGHNTVVTDVPAQKLVKVDLKDALSTSSSSTAGQPGTAFSITTGNGLTTGRGGNITLTAGNSPAGSGGNITLAPGEGVDDAHKGKVLINGPTIVQDALSVAEHFHLSPTTDPGTPNTGWVIYVDSGDGNKLKAKASTGTVAELGTP